MAGVLRKIQAPAQERDSMAGALMWGNQNPWDRSRHLFPHLSGGRSDFIAQAYTSWSLIPRQSKKDVGSRMCGHQYRFRCKLTSQERGPGTWGLLAWDSQCLSRCPLVIVGGEMLLQGVAVCAAAGFPHYILRLCLGSERDRHEDVGCAGVLSHGSGEDTFQADSDHNRCQLCSCMSEIFISLLAVSWGHSQLLHVFLQVLHEPFKTLSKGEKPGILFPFRIWPLLPAGINSAFKSLWWID